MRAFNAIGFSRMAEAAQRRGERIGMPIAGENTPAKIREIAAGLK